MDNDSNNDNKSQFEWRRMLLRKDRPLPKAGCSWAFYILLLAMIVYLIIMFLKYKQI